MNSIPREIRCINNLLKRNIEAANKNNDLTRIQSWIIGFIYHNDSKDIFQKDIENEFNIRRSTTSEIIKNMENKEYLIRESVNYDQRLKKLVLTQKAIEHHLGFLEFTEKFDKRLASCLTSEELELFFELTNKIKVNLSKEECK